VVHSVRSVVLRFLDNEVRENLEKNMKKSGYDYRLKTTIKKIEKVGENDFRVTIQNL